MSQCRPWLSAAGVNGRRILYEEGTVAKQKLIDLWMSLMYLLQIISAL